MVRKVVMEGLLCSGCAGKIEKKVNELIYVNNAVYNLANQTMLIEFINEYEEHSALKEIIKIVDSIEDGVNTYYKGFKKEKSKNTMSFAAIFLGVFIFVIASILGNFYLYVISYLLVTNKIIKKTINNIKSFDFFDENTLMIIATIGAMYIGEYFEAIAVILFYTVGEYLQDRAVDKSKGEVSNLISLKIEYANIYENDKFVLKDPSQIKKDDIILVKPGEKIPIDGLIIEGNTSLDTSNLTGETKLKDVSINDEVLSGMLNINGVIKIRATKLYEDSTLAKIIDLIENSTINKTKTEQFITKFANVYTPIVTLLAFLLVLIPTLINKANFDIYLYRAAVFLVISCPCALVLSIPLSYFAGIGKSAKHGILFKGSNYLDALNKVSDIFLDKTGTITHGNFVVTNYTTDETLRLAASIEKYSNHPIATAIINQYDNDLLEIKEVTEEAGHGLVGFYEDERIIVGNEKLMNKYNITINKENNIGTVIYVAKNEEFIGSIQISDEIKESSISAVKDLILKNKNIHMLTGDNELVSKNIASKLGNVKCHSELLPIDKVDILNDTPSKEMKLFVGDGINDGPVLANADIGVAMGQKGSDLAVEVADVIIINDDLKSLSKAFDISKLVRKIVIQNIIFALGIKVLFLILGALGIAYMWMAIFADVGVALLAVLNSLRILYNKD